MSEKKMAIRLGWALWKMQWEERLMTGIPLDKPAQVRISLIKMCEAYGNPEYILPICNRVFQTIEQSTTEVCMKHLFIDASDLSNLAIDRIGLIVWEDLLLGYFDEDFLLELWQYAKELEAEQRVDFELQGFLQKATTSKLKQLLKGHIEQEQSTIDLAKERGVSEERLPTAKEGFDKLIIQELQRRKNPLTWVKKAFHKAIGHGEGVYICGAGQVEGGIKNE